MACIYGVHMYTGITEDLGPKLAITHANMPCAYPLGNVKVHMFQSDQLSLVSYSGYIVLDVFDQEPFEAHSPLVIQITQNTIMQ